MRKLPDIRAIALDRDGTINVDVGYPHRTNDLDIIDGFREFMQWATSSDLPVFVTTNQSGVARGYFCQEDVNAFNNAISTVIKRWGCKIERFEICAHHPNDNCNCRKPRTGMLERLSADYGIAPEHWIVFGDKTSDIEFAKRFGAYAVLVGEKKLDNTDAIPDLQLDNLGEFPQLYRNIHTL